MPSVPWQTAQPAADYHVLAPDGSEIRLLVSVGGGSMVHCTLQAGQVSQAVRHRTVEEVWYCLRGRGQLWRRTDEHEEVVELRPGTAASIPLRTDFQFRASGETALEIVITTVPPWPGEQEAVAVAGMWSATP